VIYTVIVYCDLGPKLGLVVKKAPSLTRKLDGALAPRTSLRLKVTQIGIEMGFFFFFW